MAPRHSLILLLALGSASPAAAQTPPASTDPSRDERVCAAQADKNNITGAGRDTFLRECVAGQKLDRSKAEPSKP